jgi:hypothetical protein
MQVLLIASKALGRKKLEPTINYTVRVRPELKDKLDALFAEFEADPKWREASLPSYARFIREILLLGAETLRKKLAARK